MLLTLTSPTLSTGIVGDSLTAHRSWPFYLTGGVFASAVGLCAKRLRGVNIGSLGAVSLSDKRKKRGVTISISDSHVHVVENHKHGHDNSFRADSEEIHSNI